MRRLPAAALAAAGLLAGLPAAAQESPAPGLASPVLTLDQDDLFESSAFGQRVRREIEAASAALTAENRRLEAELAEEELRLTELRATTDPEAFRLMAAEFDARVVEVRRTQDQKGRDLARRREEARQEFFRAAIPVLADLVRERGAVAILDSRAVIISADLIDITDEAMRRIDATLGDGTAADPAAPEQGGGVLPAPPDDAGAAPPGAPTDQHRAIAPGASSAPSADAPAVPTP